jgi:hypothetical protein
MSGNDLAKRPPDCLDTDSEVRNLLYQEQFTPAFQTGADHLREVDEHDNYSCRYNLAVACWGLGATAVGDKLWPLGTRYQQDAIVFSPATGERSSISVNLGPRQEEILSERMYHRIRNGQLPAETESALYLRDIPQMGPGVQAPAYILAAWLQARKGEFGKAIELTDTFTPFAAKGRIDVASARYPLVWHNRLDAIRMICYGAVGDLLYAEQSAHKNRNHPVPEVRDGAAQIERSRYLVSERLRQNKVRKIAMQLLRPRQEGISPLQDGILHSLPALTPSEKGVSTLDTRVPNRYNYR